MVSLCPSATETAFALGLGDFVCGVSHQCDYPPQVKKLPRLTDSIVFDGGDSAEIARKVEANTDRWGTIYDVDEEQLASLCPNLILTQKVCKVCAYPVDEVLEMTSRRLGACEVIPFTANRVQDIFEGILKLSEAAGILPEGEQLVERLQEALSRVRHKAASLPPKRTFIMEWIDPVKNAGHWIPELMKIAGGEERLGNWDGKTGVRWDEVTACDPEVILVSPCGFDFERTLQEWQKLEHLSGWKELKAVKEGEVFLGNGQVITRYTPRIARVVKAMAHMLHPDAFPKGEDLEIIRKLPL